MTLTAHLSGPIFKFSRETNAVRVENILPSANRLEVVALFRSLIGEIRASQDSGDALEITFSTADAARKALCMSGYNIAGSVLRVTPIIRSASPAPCHSTPQGRRTDIRRNLYVLGVPFGMTNQTLAALFTPYGTVTHGVILATLDGASRRRGFVVMSTHEEAKRAMTALGRNGKGGGGLDISWAVVQRSKGFLDGGDRAGVVQSSASSLSSPSAPNDELPTDSQALPNLSATPTTTVLLANLPSLLFGSQDDLRGLVCPFGSVEALRIIQIPIPSFASGSPLSASVAAPTPIIAAVVQYSTLSAAQDARHALDGELYAGCSVRVAYLEAEPASAPESPLLETPTFPTQLSFPRPLSAPFVASGSRCGLPMHKPVFDGRNVGN
ncbi:hypothetical protein GGX14DRAFT_672929, partial [Mycena pura]